MVPVNSPSLSDRTRLWPPRRQTAPSGGNMNTLLINITHGGLIILSKYDSRSFCLYSCRVSRYKKSGTPFTLFHTKVLRVARPSRKPPRPCFSAPYNLEPSLAWGGIVLAFFPWSVTCSLEGRAPPKKECGQPERRGGEDPLTGGWRELSPLSSLAKCSRTFCSRGRRLSEGVHCNHLP